MIILVGMPGGGKSTVGRHLARQIGWDFIDSDTEIERRLGAPIRVYFETHGEAGFRDVEEQVVADLTQHRDSRVVLATGGGVVLKEANRTRLRDGGTVLYLRSAPEELFRRLRNDKQRPLLQVPDPLRRLRELYQARDPLYRQVADYVVETGRPSVPTLVNMIRMQLELAGVLSGDRN